MMSDAAVVVRMIVSVVAVAVVETVAVQIVELRRGSTSVRRGWARQGVGGRHSCTFVGRQWLWR